MCVYMCVSFVRVSYVRVVHVCFLHVVVGRHTLPFIPPCAHPSPPLPPQTLPLPHTQTLLPLTPKGEICDVDGNCVDAAEDEIFKLTTVDGKLAVETEKVYCVGGCGVCVGGGGGGELCTYIYDC